MALQTTLAGRKVRDAINNRTNLYVLDLANSGVCKDHARKVNARILYEAGLADGLGTSFASGEGIEDRLFVQPATLFQVDDFDGLLLKATQAKDARHEQIVSILLQTYLTAASAYVMRAKANRERSVIDQLGLCLFGIAVPKQVYEALSSRLLTNGFLARLVILECCRRGAGWDDPPDPFRKRSCSPPAGGPSSSPAATLPTSNSQSGNAWTPKDAKTRSRNRMPSYTGITTETAGGEVLMMRANVRFGG